MKNDENERTNNETWCKREKKTRNMMIKSEKKMKHDEKERKKQETWWKTRETTMKNDEKERKNNEPL